MDFTGWTIEDLEAWAGTNEEAKEELERRRQEEKTEPQIQTLSQPETQTPPTAPPDNQTDPWFSGTYQEMGLAALNSAMRGGDLLASAEFACRLIESGSAGDEKAQGIRLLKETVRNLGSRRGAEDEEALDGILYDLWTFLGNAYESGISDPPDMSEEDCMREAFRCYEEAHEKRKTEVDNLARCYERGIGTDRNPEMVFELFEEAAALGGYEECMRAGYARFLAGNRLFAEMQFDAAGVHAKERESRCQLAQTAWMYMIRDGYVPEEFARQVWEHGEVDLYGFLALIHNGNVDDHTQVEWLSQTAGHNHWLDERCRDLMNQAQSRIDLKKEAEQKALKEAKEAERAALRRERQAIREETMIRWQNAQTEEEQEQALHDYFDSVVFHPASHLGANANGFNSIYTPLFARCAAGFGYDELSFVHACFEYKKTNHKRDDELKEYIDGMPDTYDPTLSRARGYPDWAYNGAVRFDQEVWEFYSAVLRRRGVESVALPDPVKDAVVRSPEEQEKLNNYLDTHYLPEGQYEYMNLPDGTEALKCPGGYDIGWLAHAANIFGCSDRYLTEVKLGRIRNGFDQSQHPAFRPGELVLYYAANRTGAFLGKIETIMLQADGSHIYHIMREDGDIYDPNIPPARMIGRASDYTPEDLARLVEEGRKQREEELNAFLDNVVFLPVAARKVYSGNQMTQYIAKPGWVRNHLAYDLGALEITKICYERKQEVREKDLACMRYIDAMHDTLDLTWGACINAPFPYPAWAQEGAKRFGMEEFAFYTLVSKRRGIEYAFNPNLNPVSNPVFFAPLNVPAQRTQFEAFLDSKALPAMARLRNGNYRGDIKVNWLVANPYKGRAPQFLFEEKLRRMKAGIRGAAATSLRAGDQVEFKDEFGHPHTGIIEMLDADGTEIRIVDSEGIIVYCGIKQENILRIIRKAGKRGDAGPGIKGGSQTESIVKGLRGLFGRK